MSKGKIHPKEKCEECGGNLKQIKEAVQGGGSFATSAKHECTFCGHEQHVPMW